MVWQMIILGRIYPSRGPKRGIEMGSQISLKFVCLFIYFIEYIFTNAKYIILNY